MATYGEDLIESTCGECAADFCAPCWSAHYDAKADEVACVAEAEVEAMRVPIGDVRDTIGGPPQWRVRYHAGHGEAAKLFRTMREPDRRTLNIGTGTGDVLTFVDEASGNIHIVAVKFVVSVTKYRQNLHYGSWHPVTRERRYDQ